MGSHIFGIKGEKKDGTVRSVNHFEDFQTKKKDVLCSYMDTAVLNTVFI